MAIMHRITALLAISGVALSGSGLQAQDWTFESLGPGAYYDMAVETDGTPHVVHSICTHREVCLGPGDATPRYLIHRQKLADSWVADTLSMDTSGFTPTVTLDGTGDAHIAYVDSLFKVHYLRGVAGGPWTREPLPHTATGPRVRREPAIAVDDTGGVHVSYVESERLFYQYRSTSGVWTEEQLTGATGEGEIARSSIKIGSDGVVRIAYWLYFQASGVLFEKTAGVWTQDLIGGSVVGTNPALVLDASNHAHILYTNYFNDLTYATNQTGSWQEEPIDAYGEAGDMILAGDGSLIIVYPSPQYYVSNDELFVDYRLMLSVRDGTGWHRQILDSVSGPYESITFSYRPVLAIDAQGTLHLACLKPASNPDQTEIRYGTRSNPVGVEIPREDAALQLRAAPNPFNPSTTLVYTVPSAGNLQIDVYDVRGHRVRALVNHVHRAGSHTVRWDGRNDRGAEVGSGVYLVRLKTATARVTRRVVLLK